MSRSRATTRFSLKPAERAALDEFQELVGVSSRAEALRRYFLADLPRLNSRLRALRDSGLEPSVRPELDQTFLPEERDEVRSMYGSSGDADEPTLLTDSAPS